MRRNIAQMYIFPLVSTLCVVTDALSRNTLNEIIISNGKNTYFKHFLRTVESMGLAVVSEKQGS